MSVLNIKKSNSSTEDIIQKFGVSSETHEDEARLITNDEGIILYSNENFIEIAGYTSEINGIRITDLIEFEDPKAVTRNGEVSGTFIHSNTSFNFVLNWVISHNQKVLILSAHPVLEYQVRDQISPFIEMSFDAQIITNKSGQILEKNKNFSNIFGTSNEENLENFIHKDDVKKFTRFYQTKTSENLTTRTNNQDNQMRWIMWTKKYHNDDIYFLARDITERETHRIELEEHQAHIREAEIIANMG